jgi:hypothetical protein
MTKHQSIQESSHYSLLSESYDRVGQETWEGKDFNRSSLEVSRDLFTEDSLIKRNPRPKNLEVYALLSGLPFEGNFSKELVKVQKEIDRVLSGSLRYWVLEENLGLEYCVFKWPEGSWNKDWESEIYSNLPKIEKTFKFVIFGIQINPDGGLVAKGFDEDGEIFKFRNRIKEKLGFLPKRQSSWAHVPLGRILEPLGEDKFSKLAKLCKELSSVYITSCRIGSVKFIHEKQWYMEERVLLKEYKMGNNN